MRLSILAPSSLAPLLLASIAAAAPPPSVGPALDVSAADSGAWGAVAVEASSSGYAVFWNQFGAPNFFVRLLPDGGAIDPAPTPIEHSEVFNAPAFYSAMGGGYFGALVPSDYDPLPIFSIAGTVDAQDGGAAVTWLGTVGTAANDPSPLAVTCLPDRCLIVWEETSNLELVYAEVVGSDGAPLATPVSLGAVGQAVAAANDGTGFLVAHGTAVTPISASGVAAALTDLGDAGVVGDPETLVWGGDRYLLLDGNDLVRLSSGGATIGAVEIAPTLTPSAGYTGVGWDGRAFLLYELASIADGGAVAAELPSSAPSTGLTQFMLFQSAQATGVASASAGSALAVGIGNDGNVVAAVVGPPADAGEEGGAAENDGGGSPGDAGSDATVTDASAATEPDATADAAIVATDAAGGEDAGSAAAAPGGTSSGGCGCAAVGTTGAGGAGGLLGALFALVGLSRRRVRSAR